MFKTRYSVPGSSPATLVAHDQDGNAVVPKVTLIEYDAAGIEEREIKAPAELENHLGNDKVTWINIDGLGDTRMLEALGKRFNLHPLTLEDVLNTGQRPKVEDYSDYLFIVLHMVYRDSRQRICGEQVSIFLGERFLITIQEEADNDVFDPVRDRLRSGRGSMRKSGADYLAYALVDSIIDHYFPILECLGGAIEDLEDAMLEKPEKSMVFTLHDYRRNLTQLRRFVWPMRDVVTTLLHESSGQISDHTKVFLRDCYDHSVQLMDFVESYKELTTGLMELYHSSVGLRTNEIMRVLTVITSIFIPLTFIAGVYGMNFAPAAPDGKSLPLNMPELYHPHGYLVVIGLMLVIAAAQLLFFRKKGWL